MKSMYFENQAHKEKTCFFFFVRKTEIIIRFMPREWAIQTFH